MSELEDLVNREYDEPMDEDEPEPVEEYPCACPFCVCFVKTRDGGICDSCCQGAHQG